MAEEERFHTVVVGGGQAGLAAAYYLKKLGIDYIVLESRARLGDVWRDRWDSLRLFTPSKFNSLPGAPFPGDAFYFATKDEAALYLEAYAEKFDLPVRRNMTVDTLARHNGEYLLTSGPHRISAENVIVATGAYQQPVIPSLARDLNPGIVQMHSSEYKRPDQLPEGNILVVGAGNSGGEIALELARERRKVWLSGRDVGRIPANTFGRVLGGRPYWFFISRVLNVRTPIGRKVRQKALHQGTPLIRLAPRDFPGAGITRTPRVSSVNKGLPQLQNGQTLDVQGIVWATGFRPEYSWIKLSIFDENGSLEHEGGVVGASPGLYFLGLHFQTALTSALLGGVGTDAQRIVEEIRSRGNGHGLVGSRASRSRDTGVTAEISYS